MHSSQHPRSLVPLVFLALPLFAACGGAPASEETVPPAAEGELSLSGSVAPDHFAKVRDGLYRGAHPGAQELNYLKALGVRRILDLEVDDMIEAQPGQILLEEGEARFKGFTLIREPMSAFEAAIGDEFDQRIARITKLLKTGTASDPIYVHCKHGQDRTGLVIGLERVDDEGWAPKAAFDEMIAHGFHTYFLGLDEYFERKTKFNPG